MNDLRYRIPQEIRSRREAQKITRWQLSLKSGIAEQTIGFIERNNQRVTFEHAERLLAALGTSIELVDGAERIDWAAIAALGRVMAEGHDTHPDEGWRSLPVGTHVRHAIQHLDLWNQGDWREDHLAHAFTRLMMAVAVEMERKGRSQ